MSDFYLVDAFAQAPFAGNPAFVLLLDRARPDDWLVAMAKDTAAPATCFLWNQDGRRRLRWFGGEHEIPLCGHGTLATSHVLWRELGVTEERLEYDTKSGLVGARLDGDLVELDLPAIRVAPAAMPPALTAGLGVDPVEVLHGGQLHVAVLRTAEQVRNLRPEYDALSGLDGVVVVATAPGDRGFDICSRVFVYRSRTEDQATGSAHAVLGQYWARKLGKSELRAEQASPRGAVLRLRPSGERTLVAGPAITVGRGTLVALAAPVG